MKQRTRASVARTGSVVVLHWQDRTGSTSTDAVTGAVTGGTLVARTKTVRGNLHWPDFAKTQVKQFAEIQQGDLIIDFSPDVVPEGKTGLRFEVNGNMYAQKGVSDRLAKAWDVIVHDVKLAHTVLLQRIPA